MTKNHILTIAFITILLDMAGVGVLFPVFPLLINPGSEFFILPTNWHISSGYIMLGWLSATFPFMQFIFTPILGQLADKFGRKPILLISITGTTISYLIFAYGLVTKNIVIMFIGRAIDGMTGANISVVQAIIADISEISDRGRNFSIVGMGVGLGFILGPILGGILTDVKLSTLFHAATPFYTIGILSLINLLIIYKFLPETLRNNNIKSVINLKRPITNLYIAFSQNELKNIMPSSFLFNAGFCLFTTFFAINLSQKFHFNQAMIGGYFAYLGISVVLAQIFVTRNIAKYYLDYQVLRFSQFGTSICLLCYFFVPSSQAWMLYLIAPCLAISNALTNMFNTAIVARITPDYVKAQGLGINSSVIAVAQTIPAVLSGYISTMHTMLPTLVGSILVGIGGLLFWRLFKNQ